MTYTVTAANRRKGTRVLALFALLGPSGGSARADWAWTRWGMTAEQLAAPAPWDDPTRSAVPPLRPVSAETESSTPSKA
jgi:hypothetical protein